MTATGHSADISAGDALLAASLLAIAGGDLGGALLSGDAGELADAWLDAVTTLQEDRAPPVRVPRGISTAQLTGGLDLAATLARGVPVHQGGLLQNAATRPLLLTGVERWSKEDFARLFAITDRRSVSASNVILAVDGSAADDEPIASALRDRQAFHIVLSGVRPADLAVGDDLVAHILQARALFSAVAVDDRRMTALLTTAVALGCVSSRGDRYAIVAARAHAALRGSTSVEDEDAEVAARLVLVPRATRWPQEAAPPEEPEATSHDEPPPERESADDQASDPGQPSDGLEDRLIDAASVALPPGLLEALRGGAARGVRPSSAGRGDGRKRRSRRGRPIGHFAGDPRQDGPLNLVATLERAAPWQVVRRRLLASRVGASEADRRLLIMPTDIRVTRFKDEMPSVTIFAVDASGSSAMHRMGEAKGAIEMLLADCYVRREQVALVAFRKTSSETLLAPTRALAKARRALSGLPGGGATPLATGLDAAHDLALKARRAGQSSLVVVLTDGRANIDRSGAADRKRAHVDAMSAAQRLAEAGCAALLIDTSPAPSPKAAEIAGKMNARYLPLPNAGARDIAAVVARERASA